MRLIYRQAHIQAVKELIPMKGLLDLILPAYLADYCWSRLELEHFRMNHSKDLEGYVVLPVCPNVPLEEIENLHIYRPSITLDRMLNEQCQDCLAFTVKWIKMSMAEVISLLDKEYEYAKQVAALCGRNASISQKRILYDEFLEIIGIKESDTESPTALKLLEVFEARQDVEQHS